MPTSSISGYGDVDVLTESFNEIDLGNSGPFQHGEAVPPSHRYVVFLSAAYSFLTFSIPKPIYHTTPQGREKLNHAESEIRNLLSIRYLKLLSIYAVKLNPPHLSGPPSSWC